jgi:putative nucleotidyltransferase with HDIG domain
MIALTPAQVHAAINALPSMPAVVSELMVQLDHDDVNLADLARKIGVDPALTVRVLRLANSSFYGLKREVRTLDEAVAVLGLRSLRNLVTTAAVMDKLTVNPDSALAFEAYWRHALGTALCARGIATRKGLDPESAYVAGLLHDIGRLALATLFSGPYKQVLERQAIDDIPLVQAEHATLGLDHAMVGAALARHWNFPESIRQAIAEHHNTSQTELDTLVMVTHAADALAHALDFEGAQNAMVPPIQQSAWDRLQLREEDLRAVASQADQGFAAACGMLQ